MRVFTDTSNYFNINSNDVICAGEDLFLVRGTETEKRFGLDDEPKYWVKRAHDLRTGRRKVLKLAFFETYEGVIGQIKFTFFRNPKKEARILNLVKGHPHFMQGYSVEDDSGNNLRILDFVEGPTLADHIIDLPGTHEEYFHNQLPEILDKLLQAYTALRLLHEHRTTHGDIRRDHLLVEKDSGRYVWIDFDYAYRTKENPFGFDLFGLGNVLAFVVGKGDVLMGDLRREQPDLAGRMIDDDLNIVWSNRVMNLRKIYPYIPIQLHHTLMHFSRGTEVYYDSVDDLIEDIGMSRDQIHHS
ncbi:MAG: protein kinase family protein [Deltaproteobacteria bacterium]|nr:protein kinase family protein [Deltaproteobacteria bacterium]